MAKKKNSKMVYVVLGGGLLILGISSVLAWWPQVVNLFKGMAGMILAVAGLVVLYLIKD